MNEDDNLEPSETVVRRRLRAKAQGLARSELVINHFDEYQALYAKHLEQVFQDKTNS